MLAQFALVVFAMCAVLSLIVDVGYARITQAQMQNAADTAALEGLRKRDVGVLNPATGQVVDDQFASDCLRRTAANRVVHWVFDDDFNPTNGDPDYQFGAGPIIDLTDGVTSLHALQTLSVPDVHVYKPDLQLNQENAAHGDMVSGSFSYSPDSAPSEDLDYARSDFNPNLTVPQPTGVLPACPPAGAPQPDALPPPVSAAPRNVENSAFLVRLRRSNELRDTAGQTEPGVASSGPSLPLVFGKGTMISGDDPSSTYSVRRDGLTVRATAIAEIRPALHVGLPQPQSNPLQPGVTPFALLDTCIQNVTGAQVTINATVNPATGVITRTNAGAPPCPLAGTVVGRFVANPTAISTVGRALPAPANVACTAVNSFAGRYGPVYSLMTSGTNRIIGFSRITWTRNTCPTTPGAAFTATIARGVSLVAASNATGSLIGGLPLPASAQPAEVTELLDKNRIGPGRVNYGPVFVPVLAR